MTYLQIQRCYLSSLVVQQKQQQEMDFEIRFYEGIVKNSPDFHQALIALGDLYTRKGLVEKGMEIDNKLSQLRPDDPIVFYNLACSYSLLNRIEDARTAMKTAFARGYDDFRHLERDQDLKNLMKDRGFQQYLSREKEKKTGQGKTESL